MPIFIKANGRNGPVRKIFRILKFTERYIEN